MICSEFTELLDRYESLTDVQHRELEEHASKCEVCHSEFEFFKSITAISNSIPLPKAPDTLIDDVNARLDNERSIHFRPNVRILSTVAACLVLGISVGVNNGFIKKNIDGDNSDGVITEAVMTTEKPISEPTPAVEQEVETNSPNIAVNPTPKAEKEETSTAKKAVAELDKKTAPKSTAAPNNTSKPTAQPRTSSAPIKSEATAQPITASVSAKSETKTPASTQTETTAPIKETDAPTNATQIPQATEKSEQTTAPVEVADNTHNVDDYAVSKKREATVYGYYDTIQDKRSTSVMSDYLYVESDYMGTVVSTMSEMGIKNAEGYYMSSREDFYTLIDTLNDKGVEFECDLKYNSGDNVSFRLTYD